MIAANRAPPALVGLVGTGDWAQHVHAPILAEGPETRLVGVWGRNREKAKELAARHGCRPYADFDDLIQASELVSFAVSPAVQPALARRAVHAGRHVLLEKPIAASVEDSASLSDVIRAKAVRSVLFLTYHYSPLVASFVRGCAQRSVVGGRLGFFAATRPSEVTGWRRERGLLLDVGFHVFDLLDSALGGIQRITAHGDGSRWVGLLVDHAGGRFSEATVSWAGLAARRTELEVFTGADETMALDPKACVRGAWLAPRIRQAVWAAVRADGHGGAGIERGVYLQRCVRAAERSLRRRGTFVDVA